MAIVTLPLPIQLINGNIADGGQVMTDLNAIASNVNSNAAKNGVNNDITSLTALVSIAPGLTITGANIFSSSFAGGTITTSSIATSTIDNATTGVTQAAGTNNTTLATTAFVVNTAFNSGLPAQNVGTTNKVPVSNGSVASWQFVDLTTNITGNLPVTRLNSGTNASSTTYWRGDGTWQVNVPPTLGSTQTGSYTFTAISGSVSVTPTALGQYVTLAAGTTFQKGIVGSIRNASADYALGVKDSTGTQLGWLHALAYTDVTCSDNSTAAGVFGMQLDKVAATAAFANATLVNASNSPFLGRVVIDTNRTFLLFGSTTAYGIVYDASTQTFGAITTIRTGVGIGNITPQGILSAANQVLVVTCDGGGSTAFQAVTLTISGTAITVNTPVAIVLPTQLTFLRQIVAVGSAFVVPYLHAATGASMRAITVSGTVPTIGAEAVIYASADPNGMVMLYANGSSSVLGIAASNSAHIITATPATLSGTTLTVGTSATKAYSGLAGSFRSLALASGRWLTVYNNNTITTDAGIISVAANVATWSSTVVTTQVPDPLVTWTEIVAVSATKVLMWCAVSGTTQVTVNVIVDNAGTVNVGTAINLEIPTSGNVPALGGLVNVTGNNVSFAVLGTQYAVATVDASGSSPVLSSVIAVWCNPVYGPTISDFKNLRAPSNLIAGNSVYSLLTPSPPSGLSVKFSPNSILFYPEVPIPAVSGASTGASGANNEIWAYSAYNGSVGVTLARLEAAA